MILGNIKIDLIKKGFSLIMVCYYIFIISSFSSQNADTSSEKSQGITLMVYEAVIEGLELESKITYDDFKKTVEPILRKCAHFFNFFMLSMFMIIFVKSYINYDISLYVILFCAMVAIMDEINQLFVPERACQLRDVLIDISGSVFGILAYVFSKRLFGRCEYEK